MYKIFLTIRYLRKRRIAYFAIGAVTLCTAMVLIVSSVMGGFLDKLKLKARGLLGDVIVRGDSARGFPLYQELIDEIKQWPEIVEATPVIVTYGMMKFEDSPSVQTVIVSGIKLEETYRVNAFKSGLFYEQHYPGTTTFAPQQQPVVGFDDQRSARKETPEGTIILPVLPLSLADALAKSRAADTNEDDVYAGTRLNEALAEYNLPLIPGVFARGSAPELSNERPRPGFEGEPRDGAIIGRDLVAKRLRDGSYRRYDLLPRGCVVTLTLLPISDAANVDTPIKYPFRYADDSRTGIYEIDSQQVYVAFEVLQKLLQMDAGETIDGDPIPARASQIQIKVAAGVDATALARRLERHFHLYRNDERFNLTFDEKLLLERTEVVTWEESQAHYIKPVEKERQLVTILFGTISLVAAVLVLCILYMIVLQKTRDIGIVKSIGGSSAGVASIFMLYGVAIGVVGSISGSVLGTLFVVYINDIQDLLVWLNPAWQVWDRSVYSFDEIPNTVRPIEVAFIAVGGIFMATMGSMTAAWRAGSMHPVEALRYE